MPTAPGTDLIIEHRARRFSQNHKRVVKKLRAMTQAEGVKEEEQPEKLELEIPNNLEEWEHAQREAAARPGVVGRLTDVINRLVAAKLSNDDLTQRAGPSGTYHPPPSPVPARRDSSQNDENDAEAATSRKRKRPRNPFILDEAKEYDDDDEEEEVDTVFNDYDFIDDDD